MLENAERDGYSHVISWMPDGKSFKIHVDGSLDEEDEKAIIEILKRTFKQTRFKSFLRQLQLYGFERICKGPRRGECKHGLFVRGRRDLLHRKSIEYFQQSSNSIINRSPKSVRKLFYTSPALREVTSFVKNNGSRINACALPLCLQIRNSRTEDIRCQYLNTSTIPTRLTNLVLSDCEHSDQQSNSYDDDKIPMGISFPLNNEELEVVDDIDEGDLISIHIGEHDFSDWTGTELEILQRVL